MGVIIQPINFEKDSGYSVKITRDDATVQDYLDSINQAILNFDLSRLLTHGKDCYGCPLCCKNRIPLTMIDIQRLTQSPWIMNLIPSGAKKHRENMLFFVLNRFSYITIQGSIVDITINMSQEGDCPFLDESKGTCNVYNYRPFVCQSFICCPMEKKASEIREAIVNIGEDELVRWLYNYALKEGLGIWYNEASNYMVDSEDLPVTVFENKESYTEIYLKDLLPGELWRKIRT